jgi:pimeloyl-ACP methyl ester carboxylesterase
MAVTVERSAGDTTIRPFTIDIPDADLEDLRARIAATRWADKETVDDASQGVQLAAMQALARYWETEYDWRRCEARLNSVPNFITEIDGLDIHFVHVRSKHEDALPVLVCHGWPGSVIEQMKIVDLLTDPTAHGASASDAFHVVIPNMPGYGFSGKPTEPGWNVDRIGRAWVELMKRLGYERFVAAGGDWGGILVDVMAAGPDTAPELIGIHSTFPGVFPDAVERRSRPMTSCRPTSQPTSDARSTRWRAPTGMRARPTWPGTRRRSSDWLTHPSPWRPGSSTTTRSATRRW